MRMRSGPSKHRQWPLSALNEVNEMQESERDLTNTVQPLMNRSLSSPPDQLSFILASSLPDSGQGGQDHGQLVLGREGERGRERRTLSFGSFRSLHALKHECLSVVMVTCQ